MPKRNSSFLSAVINSASILFLAMGMTIESNRLAAEKSPYLLQHKNNPVDWYPWGEEAFAAARNENKPIFLSIGYSTCYWCHVMEHDSFERPEVAEVMNRYLVSIKVDREERPDVDQLYMDAVTSFTGRGGWPLSVFLTPDLKPFLGGTFFYRSDFLQVLEEVHRIWTAHPAEVANAADEINEFLNEQTGRGREGVLPADILQRSLDLYWNAFDHTNGGFNGAPKFPPALQIGLLLRINPAKPDNRVVTIVTRTLDRMARGGIYDQLGGGFHRYSVDAAWHVPHFEKMLYDNALLAHCYLEAFQVLHEPAFADIARETLAYLTNEMKAPEGGFYSAQDAGEVGSEGAYYLWRDSELRRLLTAAEYDEFRGTYEISAAGDTEHEGLVLRLKPDLAWNRRDSALLRAARRKGLDTRSGRPAPHKDTKILTSWNGLALSAFSKAYQVFDERLYLETARACALFLKEYLWRGGKLLHRYCDGEAAVAGMLEDYACLIAGLLDLYESDFDPSWFHWALELQQQQDELFWDPEDAGYFSSNAPELPVRKKDYLDGALPSGNSVAFVNLVRLHHLTGEERWRERVGQLLQTASGLIAKYPLAFPCLLQGVHALKSRFYEIAVLPGSADSEARQFLRFLHSSFIPNKVVALGGRSGEIPLLHGKSSDNGHTLIYICENQTCRKPVQSRQEAEELLRS